MIEMQIYFGSLDVLGTSRGYRVKLSFEQPTLSSLKLCGFISSKLFKTTVLAQRFFLNLELLCYNRYSLHLLTLFLAGSGKYNAQPVG